MYLHIRNAETHRLAKELAEATGETITQAVTQAVRERLETVLFRKRMEAVARGEELVAREPLSIYHGDLLYDDKGLPIEWGTDFSQTDVKIVDWRPKP